MSVTSIQLFSTTGGIDGEGHRNYTAVYQLFTSSVNDCCETIVESVRSTAPGSWAFGSESNANVTPQSIGPAVMVDYDGIRRKWHCPVNYSTTPLVGTSGSGRPLAPFTTPIAEPWKISGTFVRSNKFTNFDKDGAFITMQGTEEIKAVEVPFGHDTLHLEGASSTISLSTRAQAVFKVNSATIWGLTARQLLMTNWAFQLRHHGTTEYVYHSMDFEINYDGWNEEFYNVSYMKVNPDWVSGDPLEKYLIPQFSKGGMPHHEPRPIDEDGNPCALGDAPLNNVGAIKEFNFLTLGLPNPLPGPFV